MADGSRMVMSQGPQPGQTFNLDRDILTVGRDPGNDVVIIDPQASRQHARIMRQGGLMVIEDLGSTNGTFVNGMRLTGPHTLANGDVVGIGDSVVLTFYGSSVTSTETIVGRPPAPLPAAPMTAAQQQPPRPAAPMPTPPPAYTPQPQMPPRQYTPPPAYTPAPPPPPPAAASWPVEEKKFLLN